MRANEKEVKEISEKMKTHYQKVGIVKYDAFHEMGGELSFALTMLDENNNGWIFNAMHSREGCYTYIKEVVNGESYIELQPKKKEVSGEGNVSGRIRYKKGNNEKKE